MIELAWEGLREPRRGFVQPIQDKMNSHTKIFPCIIQDMVSLQSAAQNGQYTIKVLCSGTFKDANLIVDSTDVSQMMLDYRNGKEHSIKHVIFFTSRLTHAKQTVYLYSTPSGKTDKLEEPVNKELNVTRS